MTVSKSPIDAIVMARATELGPRGINTTDIAGQTAVIVDRSVRRLTLAGRLFRGRLGYRTVRYFITPELAQAYEANKRAVSATMVGRERGRAPWTNEAPPHYPRDVDGKPLYKVTVVPPVQRPADMPIRTDNYEPW